MTRDDAEEESKAAAQAAMKMSLGMELWLDPVSPCLRAQARAAFEAGDALGFLCKASSNCGLELVAYNEHALYERGIYETALLEAYIGARVNNHGWPMGTLRFLFSIADRERLRAAGDPLPGPGPFTVYRGVSGIGGARRVRGMSWTADFELAKWFATWCYTIDKRRFADPAVFRCVVKHANVLAYVDEGGRNEREFVILPPSQAVQVWRLAEEVDEEQALAEIEHRFQLAQAADMERAEAKIRQLAEARKGSSSA